LQLIFNFAEKTFKLEQSFNLSFKMPKLEYTPNPKREFSASERREKIKNILLDFGLIVPENSELQQIINCEFKRGKTSTLTPILRELSRDSDVVLLSYCIEKAINQEAQQHKEPELIEDMHKILAKVLPLLKILDSGNKVKKQTDNLQKFLQVLEERLINKGLEPDNMYLQRIKAFQHQIEMQVNGQVMVEALENYATLRDDAQFQKLVRVCAKLIPCLIAIENPKVEIAYKIEKSLESCYHIGQELDDKRLCVVAKSMELLFIFQQFSVQADDFQLDQKLEKLEIALGKTTLRRMHQQMLAKGYEEATVLAVFTTLNNAEVVDKSTLTTISYTRRHQKIALAGKIVADLGAELSDKKVQDLGQIVVCCAASAQIYKELADGEVVVSSMVENSAVILGGVSQIVRSRKLQLASIGMLRGLSAYNSAMKLVPGGQLIAMPVAALSIVSTILKNKKTTQSPQGTLGYTHALIANLHKQQRIMARELNFALKSLSSQMANLEDLMESKLTELKDNLSSMQQEHNYHSMFVTQDLRYILTAQQDLRISLIVQEVVKDLIDAKMFITRVNEDSRINACNLFANLIKYLCYSNVQDLSISASEILYTKPNLLQHLGATLIYIDKEFSRTYDGAPTFLEFSLTPTMYNNCFPLDNLDITLQALSISVDLLEHPTYNSTNMQHDVSLLQQRIAGFITILQEFAVDENLLQTIVSHINTHYEELLNQIQAVAFLFKTSALLPLSSFISERDLGGIKLNWAQLICRGWHVVADDQINFPADVTPLRELIINFFDRHNLDFAFIPNLNLKLILDASSAFFINGVRCSSSGKIKMAINFALPGGNLTGQINLELVLEPALLMEFYKAIADISPELVFDSLCPGGKNVLLNGQWCPAGGEYNFKNKSNKRNKLRGFAQVVCGRVNETHIVNSIINININNTKEATRNSFSARRQAISHLLASSKINFGLKQVTIWTKIFKLMTELVGLDLELPNLQEFMQFLQLNIIKADFMEYNFFQELVEFINAFTQALEIYRTQLASEINWHPIVAKLTELNQRLEAAVRDRAPLIFSQELLSAGNINNNTPSDDYSVAMHRLFSN